MPTPPSHLLPLEYPPQIAQAGIGKHGHIPLERYLLPNLWCVHIFRDVMDLRVAGETFAVQAGCATIIPPGAPIEFHFPTKGVHWHAFAHFTVCGGEATPLPAFQALGERFEPLFASLEKVVASWNTEKPRAQAHLWGLLWELSRSDSLLQSDPLVRRAQELIESQLTQKFNVASLAQVLGVSHNHLTRRFQIETGSTVVAWIRERRIARAQHLLRHSTLSIKTIATQVGLGDLHSFNKAMRRVSGEAPRQWRKTHN